MVTSFALGIIRASKYSNVYFNHCVETVKCKKNATDAGLALLARFPCVVDPYSTQSLNLFWKVWKSYSTIDLSIILKKEK